MRIALAQVNTHVGAIDANVQIVFDCAEQARVQNADLVVFPELTLSGYPPEDLLLHRGMQKRVAEALEYIVKETKGVALLVGYPEYSDGEIYNSAALIADGGIKTVYRKQVLPNYAVFDEKRYFQAGTNATVIESAGISLGSDHLRRCLGGSTMRRCSRRRRVGAIGHERITFSPPQTSDSGRRYEGEGGGKRVTADLRQHGRWSGRADFRRRKLRLGWRWLRGLSSSCLRAGALVC